MAGPNLGRVLTKRYFWQMEDQLRRLLLRTRIHTTEADNADTIGGKTASDLLSPARSDLAAHVARTDNPHQETIASIGSRSDTYIRNTLAGKVPVGIIPVSTYGIGDDLTDDQTNAAWVANGWTINCNRAMNVILSGTPGLLQPWSLDLRTIDAAPANKTFYVYLYTKLGVMSYQCRADTPPEGVAIMYLGTVTTNASGIASKSFKNVIRIDTFRISDQPLGSVIPVSSGDYDAIVPFGAAWKPL